jgi:hypothetical protein
MAHPNAEVKWIQTFTGKRVDPRNMTEADICIEDIAHALSMQCRYGGHTRYFYSVAEHCILVSEAIAYRGHYGRRAQLYGLLHDADEAYLPDMCRPVKEMFPEYKTAGDRILELVVKKYYLPYGAVEEVKKVDHMLLHTEAQQLMGDLNGWYLPEPPMPEVTVQCLPPSEAEAEFLRRFTNLGGLRGQN